MKTRSRKTQPWDIKRHPTMYAPLPPLPPEWTVVYLMLTHPMQLFLLQHPNLQLSSAGFYPTDPTCMFSNFLSVVLFVILSSCLFGYRRIYVELRKCLQPV